MREHLNNTGGWTWACTRDDLQRAIEILSENRVFITLMYETNQTHVLHVLGELIGRYPQGFSMLLSCMRHPEIGAFLVTSLVEITFGMQEQFPSVNQAELDQLVTKDVAYTILACQKHCAEYKALYLNDGVTEVHSAVTQAQIQCCEPGLWQSLIGEVYTLIERNKQPEWYSITNQVPFSNEFFFDAATANAVAEAKIELENIAKASEAKNMAASEALLNAMAEEEAESDRVRGRSSTRSSTRKRLVSSAEPSSPSERSTSPKPKTKSKAKPKRGKAKQNPEFQPPKVVSKIAQSNKKKKAKLATPLPVTPVSDGEEETIKTSADYVEADFTDKMLEIQRARKFRQISAKEKADVTWFELSENKKVKSKEDFANREDKRIGWAQFLPKWIKTGKEAKLPGAAQKILQKQESKHEIVEDTNTISEPTMSHRPLLLNRKPVQQARPLNTTGNANVAVTEEPVADLPQAIPVQAEERELAEAAVSAGIGEVIPCTSGYFAKILYLNLRAKLQSLGEMEFQDMEGIIQEFVAGNYREFRSVLGPNLFHNPEHASLLDIYAHFRAAEVPAFETMLQHLMTEAANLWINFECPERPLLTITRSNQPPMFLSATTLLIAQTEEKLRRLLISHLNLN